MSPAKKKLVEATPAIGLAISTTLATVAGCPVAFICVVAPADEPDSGLMFSNTTPADLEFALQSVLRAIREATKRDQALLEAKTPSTRQH